MSDQPPERPPNLMDRLRNRHEESNTMLAVLMAGIAALFVISIVVAYNLVAGSVHTAQQRPPASATAPATTGSGTTTGSGAGKMDTGGADRQPPGRTDEENTPPMAPH